MDVVSKNTGNSYTAAEFNQSNNELENLITDAGISLSSGDLFQLSKAIANYSAQGDFYADSGAADAYVLSTLGSKQSPTSYADGMRVRFVPGNTNTGASTINIASLGVKDIKTPQGNDPVAEELPVNVYVTLQFDNGNDYFIIYDVATGGDASSKLYRKNSIENPNFDIWQRGVSQTSNGYGSDDRWVNANVGSTKVHTQQAFTIGQTDVPNNPKHYSRTVVTSVAGAGNAVNKYQRIRDVAKYSGKTVTLSFYAKADASKNIATEFLQDFGTGGSPSPRVEAIGVTTHNLTTAWQKFTTTVNISSVSGKTLGDNGDDFLRMAFWFDAGSTSDSQTNSLGQQSGTFEIAQVQAEEGDVATQFENRTLGEEIALCEPFYEKSYDIDVDPGTVTGKGRHIYLSTSTIIRESFDYSRKRAIPAITFYSTTTGAPAKFNTGSDGDISANTGEVGEARADLTATTTSSVQSIDFHWVAEAEL